jgi:hypothetical protein
METETKTETETTTDRKPTPIEQWVLRELAKSDGSLRAQVLWVSGQAANGDIRSTGIPGLFAMRIEGQDQSGRRHVLERIFPIETVLLIDLPQAVQIQRNPILVPG